MRRIEAFLQTDDHARYFHHERNERGFVLESASFTWPTDSVVTNPTFVLRGITACFPTGRLSVIGADTGSGKTLLLNALVGEADKLGDSISLPARDPSLFNDDWLSKGWPPGSDIAFVSQDGWIENATIRDNVLFGLPFCEVRYRQIIFACALKKDLEMLAEGDTTEVGVGGINLSGGQKWRHSFARALYSQASVLVIDDIFSAVDAHVGLHMYNHALTGPLARYRTRIIATHHVDLCLGKAEYFVRLDQGRVVEQRTITRHIQEKLDTRGPDTDNWSTTDTLSVTPDHPVSILHDDESRDSESFFEQSLNARRAKIVPKKFIEEEQRETGVVKLQTYSFYFQATGGIITILVVICAHLAYTGSVVGRVSFPRSRGSRFVAQLTLAVMVAPFMVADLGKGGTTSRLSFVTGSFVL